MHALAIEAHRPPVSRQHPFEGVVEKPLHRFGLLAPRIPARIAKCVQTVVALIPREMVAGEQELVAHEEDRMPFRVARRRDHQHVIGDLHRIESGRLMLDRLGARADVVAMQPALASEALMELLLIGDVVLMRE